MVSLRYLSPLVLALGLVARPGRAQKADITPPPLVRPLLWHIAKGYKNGLPRRRHWCGPCSNCLPRRAKW